MQQPMLRLSQASKLTGRHEDTIRRIIKKLLKTDLQAVEKIRREETVRGFHYIIDEEYLLKHVQPLQGTLHSNGGASGKTASDQPLRQPLNKGMYQPTHQDFHQPTHAEIKAKGETITILKRQLEQKDEQIRQLLERYRETNILLKGHQDRYLLEAPITELKDTNHQQKDQEAPKEREAEKPVAATPQTGQRPRPQKPKLKNVEQPKKKGLFSFLTGK